jgi:bifunctional DNA-binding transcriptional regulator/antitoxin component of YhaV-PrlF toxin-antitoxin module
MEDSIEYRKVQGLIGETSFSIVLPKAYAIKMGIEKGNFVKVHQEQDGSRIIVERAES